MYYKKSYISFLVTTMKKVLSELYNNNFDILRQKENRSLELEKETKEYNFSKVGT